MCFREVVFFPPSPFLLAGSTQIGDLWYTGPHMSETQIPAIKNDLAPTPRPTALLQRIWLDEQGNTHVEPICYVLRSTSRLKLAGLCAGDPDLVPDRDTEILPDPKARPGRAVLVRHAAYGTSRYPTASSAAVAIRVTPPAISYALLRASASRGWAKVRGGYEVRDAEEYDAEILRNVSE